VVSAEVCDDGAVAAVGAGAKAPSISDDLRGAEAPFFHGCLKRSSVLQTFKSCVRKAGPSTPLDHLLRE
jgi:hypothetical protein